MEAEVRQQVRQQAAESRRDLKERLLAEHGLITHPKADLLFGLAWEHGHAHGEGEVAMYFADFAELLK